MIARIQQSMREKDKGFTLIELLVVIIIIGILAAIAIPVFLNQRQKAVDTGVRSDLRTIANELETYYVDNQEYPTSGGATAGSDFTADTVTVTLSDDGTAVTYTPDSTGQTYELSGTNAKGDVASTGITYESDNGGLQN